MKKAVIYARYSSDKQTEQSIEGQLRVCEDYAKRNDMCIIDTYIDRAMTGKTDARPSFQRMIKDSAKRDWNYVLVYKLDRFSRDKYATAVHKKTLKDNGAKVVSATECIPDTPEGIIFESIIEGYAQYYSAELSQKVARGMSESRHKGNFTGGNIIYGYKVENKKVLIDNEKAEVVRCIYEAYSKDIYVKDIIANLSEQGIFNKGKPFAKNTIHKILKNEKYSGVYRYNDEVFTNIYPQIIDTEIFEKVRAKSIKNLKGSRSPDIVYLLRGKLVCGHCGKKITAEGGTAKNGERKRYYKCSGKKSGHACESKAIRKELLEKLIVNTIIKTLSKPKNLESFIDGAISVQKESLTKRTTLAILSRQKIDLETSLDNIVKAIEKGVVTQTTTKRIQELETKIEQVEQRIMIEKSKTETVLSRDDIKAFVADALQLEPQLLISTFVKQIELTNDEIKIYYNYSNRDNPDLGRDFLFYSTICKLKVPNTCSNKMLTKEMKLTMYV